MTTTNLHGELRFIKTAEIGTSRVVGIVGYVPHASDPLPLTSVRVSKEEDLDYAVTNVMGTMEDRLRNLAIDVAARQVSVEETAEGVLAWMKRDVERKGFRSQFSSIGIEEDDLLVKLRHKLSIRLKADAFKTAFAFCVEMQISGSMELIEILKPTCAQVAEIAGREETLLTAAQMINAAFVENKEWAPHGKAWVEGVAEAQMPERSP